MDGAAIALARDNRIPIIVFSIKRQGGLAGILEGKGPHHRKWRERGLRARKTKRLRSDRVAGPKRKDEPTGRRGRRHGKLRP